MSSYNNYIQQINERIQTINPYLIILFGSHAYGTPDEDSDIDLLVVLNSNDTPKTFKERTKLYLYVSELIYDISKQVPVDLIVHTIPMYRKFIEQDSSFSHELTTKGKVIYERSHPTLA